MDKPPLRTFPFVIADTPENRAFEQKLLTGSEAHREIATAFLSAAAAGLVDVWIEKVVEDSK